MNCHVHMFYIHYHHSGDVAVSAIIFPIKLSGLYKSKYYVLLSLLVVTSLIVVDKGVFIISPNQWVQ